MHKGDGGNPAPTAAVHIVIKKDVFPVQKKKIMPLYLSYFFY